jgi:hypothetical protein
MMPRSFTMIGAETMLTSETCGRISPASAALIRARVFIVVVAPSNRISTSLIGSSVTWPTNAPSTSASFTKGFSRGASSALIEGMLMAFETAPLTR